MNKQSDSARSQRVACEAHDYIEIACTFSMEVELQLTSGERIEGEAHNLVYTEGTESLLLRMQSDRGHIPLVDIKSMRALQPNPHFGTLIFD